MKLADLSSEHTQSVGGLHIAVARLRGSAGSVPVSVSRVPLARREKQVMLQPLLPCVEIVVATLQGVELLVRSPLDDLPLLHHQNLVGATDGRKPVRNHKRRPALHEIRKSVLYHCLRFGVQTGSRFVKNQDTRLG